jgi:hypothetical protein
MQLAYDLAAGPQGRKQNPGAPSARATRIAIALKCKLLRECRGPTLLSGVIALGVAVKSGGPCITFYDDRFDRGLVFNFSRSPSKQSAVIRRGRVHWSRRTTSEIVNFFNQRVQQRALAGENHQHHHENCRQQNVGVDRSHTAFNLSRLGSCEASHQG